VTLNDLEQRNSPYLAFISPNVIALQAFYVTVVEDRLIFSAEYIVFHFWPKLTHNAERPLGTTYDVHLGLIGKRAVDFLLV